MAEREHPLRVMVLLALSGLCCNLEITVHLYSYLPDGTYHMERLHQHTHFRYRQEDLGLYGNQLNYMQTCWTVGYVIGEIPSNIMLTKIRPRYWLPALEVCRQPSLNSISRHWSLITVDMDHLDFLHMQGQQCYPALCHPFLRWWEISFESCLQTQYWINVRTCRKCFLPRYAIHHRLMVSQGRTGQKIMHLSHEQFDRDNVLWLSDGCSLSSRRRWRLQGLAMVSNLITRHTERHSTTNLEKSGYSSSTA